MTNADLDNRFTYHPPSEQRALEHEAVRNMVHAVAILVDQLVPQGREKGLALTKLEEAMMWANAGLARNPEHA